MISPDDDRSSEEMLPILLETENHPEELAMGNAIPGLGGS